MLEIFEKANICEDVQTMAINLNDIEVFKPSVTTRRTGSISLVSKNNCNRLTLSKKLIEDLGNPKSIQVAFNDGNLLIGEKAFDTVDLTLKGNDSNIIYNIELVKKTINFFNLDFSGKTSITFGKHKIVTIDDKKVALISK